MKTKDIDAVQVWKELEDGLAPRLKLSVLDRAIYSYLFRHSRLEGKLRLRFSILGLAPHVRLTGAPVRESVRRLIDHGVLRLVDRSKLGHVVEVRLPGEVRGPRTRRTTAAGLSKLPHAAKLDDMDFLRTRALRQALHAREGGLCFYCLRQPPGRSHCLDHVVPRAYGGSNSYRNLVSCCLDCNSRKRDTPAADFLRRLFREGRLSAKDLSARLRAVQDLAAGKLQPEVEEAGSKERK